jgi:hypothetical protein
MYMIHAQQKFLEPQTAHQDKYCLSNVTTSRAFAKEAVFATSPYSAAWAATNTGRPTTFGLAFRLPKLSLHLILVSRLTYPLMYVTRQTR